MLPGGQVILWDVGGTLVDYAYPASQWVRGRLTNCGVDHSRLSDEHIERTYANFLRNEPQWRTLQQERGAERQWLAELLGDEPDGVDLVGRIGNDMPRYFNLYRPVPGLVPLLDELAGRKLPMAIVSNWPPSLPEFLDHHGLTRYFRVIIYSAQDGIHKPDHRIFQRALDALGVSAQRAIFVGDNPELDIAPARAMGMRTINFDPRRRSPSRDAQDIAMLRTLLTALLRR